MMDKAYIVANKKQELEVLEKLEQDGVVWTNGEEKPTEWLPSEKAFELYTLDFPYTLTFSDDGSIIWFPIEELEDELEDETIVYDGRKKEKMDKKYLVTKEFMNELIEWRDDQRLGMNTELIRSFLDVVHIKQFPGVVDDWWTDPENTVDNNNRLIAIIQWLNGEDVFEVEKRHKFVVRSDKTDEFERYSYVLVRGEVTSTRAYTPNATKFDTREEAQEWANSHQVVVEIDEEGNEVE